MFEMRFIGLMTHGRIRDDSGANLWVVVFYNVPHPPHTPLLSIHKRDYDYARTTVHPISTGDNRCWKLEGKIYTDLGSGFPQAYANDGTPSTDLPDVKKLSEITNGKYVSEAVLKLDPALSENIAAIFILPPGNIYTEDWFQKKGQLKSATGAFCVARTILFQADPANDVAFTIITQAGSETIVLKNSAQAWFTNLPHANADHAHYETHRSFFEDPDKVTIDVVEDHPALKCEKGSSDPDRPQCTTGANFTVECSNTQWP
ncbi:MAG: hypothetical protein AABO58_07830 [Acidobacteriota bacterium]